MEQDIAGSIDSAEPPVNRQPRLSERRMYSILLAGDANYNGRFFTGVLTTGIYCLPSCKARKPKPENVRFFPTVEAARAAGLRPCKKCHPDDFARGADPVLESIETLVEEIRQQPADFTDVAAIVRRSGFGATRLFELFRQHYHATPAEILVRARIAAAKEQLLTGDARLASVSSAAGFEALSSFHENFRLLTGMTPSEYRQLRTNRKFRLFLPEGYPLPYLRRALGRDQHSASERLTGNHYECAVMVDGKAEALDLSLSERALEVEISGGNGVAAHNIVTGILGLEQDAEGFVRLAKKLGLGRLTEGREGLRVNQSFTVFDGLVWAIIGQQINLSFTCLLRRRLFEKAGIPAPNGLIAAPGASAVASLSQAELLRLQFSRQKAEYIHGVAQAVAEGKMEPENWRAFSATRAERTLHAIHGLGPWSVNWVMMRSLGFSDCLPLGDTGISSGLLALLKLDERPGADAMRRLMSVFSPYRSLATAHLWQFKQSVPV
jgi:AraC family transcriptional regulator of adaptative response / DNA-3-methyladenine glycosylase II